MEEEGRRLRGDQEGKEQMDSDEELEQTERGKYLTTEYNTTPQKDNERLTRHPTSNPKKPPSTTAATRHYEWNHEEIVQLIDLWAIEECLYNMKCAGNNDDIFDSINLIFEFNFF